MEVKPESLHALVLLAKILFLSDKLFLAKEAILRVLEPKFKVQPEPELELDSKFGAAYKWWNRIQRVESLITEGWWAGSVEASIWKYTEALQVSPMSTTYSQSVPNMIHVDCWRKETRVQRGANQGSSFDM